MDKLLNLPSGDYIAGFVDGEGCFALTFRKDIRHKRKGSPIYYSWKASFVICLRGDDNELLEKIKVVLDCGWLSFTKDNQQIRFEISNLDELKEKIVPFFNKHGLYGKKKYDFMLWSEAVKILCKYKMKRKISEKGKRGFLNTLWDQNDISKLMKIQKEMSAYKSKRPPLKWSGRNPGRNREEIIA